jgi:hypothetical protein
MFLKSSLQGTLVIKLAFLALVLNASPGSSQASCNFNKSIYHDVDGQGFELSFKPTPSNSSVYITSIATLKHSRRGTIFKFDVTQMQGYGTTFLTHISGGQEKSHGLYFFENNLKRTYVILSRGRDSNAVPYIFVEGLGVTDYYDNRQSGGRDVILGDVMWKFSRCQ